MDSKIQRGMSSVDKGNSMLCSPRRDSNGRNRYNLQTGISIQDHIAMKKEKLMDKSPQYNKQILNTSRNNNKY